MPPKRSRKKPSTATSDSDEDSHPKPSRKAWKTGEQFEYLLSCWDEYLTHQDRKKLKRLWLRIYDHWYNEWPITPTPESVVKHGSPEKALDVFRKLNNKVRITNPYPHTPVYSYLS